jgi:hypothetical protein
LPVFVFSSDVLEPSICADTQQGMSTKECRGAGMTVENVAPIRTEYASKQGWVLVLVREQHLRQLLLVVLGQAGYMLLGCSTPAEAELPGTAQRPQTHPF